MRLRAEVASKSDMLGLEEWSSFTPSALFSSKPATARGDGAYKVGERLSVLAAIHEAPPLSVQLQQEERGNLCTPAVSGGGADLIYRYLVEPSRGTHPPIPKGNPKISPTSYFSPLQHS